MRISDWSSDVCSSDLDGPILIHGGGNMGTLWPKHEAFRLHLLRTHRGHPVVQMPQSIHYADPAAAAEMAEAIRNHGQFTLLVRDARSLAFAERSEEHTSELQSLMRISYAGFCLKKKTITLLDLRIMHGPRKQASYKDPYAMQDILREHTVMIHVAKGP